MENNQDLIDFLEDLTQGNLDSFTIMFRAKELLKEIKTIEKVINQRTSEKCDCPYCGEKSDSTDPSVLCEYCRETFGHTFVEEL
jgi:hypothetical protein